MIQGKTDRWILLATLVRKQLFQIFSLALRGFENLASGSCRIFSVRDLTESLLLFNLKTSINIDWDDNTPISACVHVKSVIRDGDVEIHSQMSFKNTQKLDMLYTSLLKCICIIFTNQNTRNIFYYKTLGNVTFEICNLKGHTCVYYQYETPEELH